MRSKIFTIIITLLLVLVSQARASKVQSASMQESGIASKTETARLVLATARRIVDELDEPTIKEAKVRGVYEAKRQKLLKAFDKLLVKGHRPTAKELFCLHKWHVSLYRIACSENIHSGASKEGKRFIIGLAMSQGYVDAAIHIVGN